MEKIGIGMEFHVVMPQVAKWEYMYLPLPNSNEDSLNELGRDGWQVILYIMHSNSFLLGREIQQPPVLEELEVQPDS